jgi:serine/threonine protein kinase/WD40 repeat protein
MPGPAFKRVEELFHQTLALDPAERIEFLDAACAGDADLRAAVEELLRHDEEKPTDVFLTSPIAREAERLRPDSVTLLDVGQGGPAAALSLPHIPGYEVLEEIGRGGMGVVYQARQTNLNRIVALKMLPDGVSAPHLFARFRAEAEALARLHHPNIVPIYDIGEWQGRPYFTMEYVAGPSLAEALAGRPQNCAASAGLVEVVARAMHAVHQSGLIHRDLKPANILLQKERSQSRKAAKEDQEEKEEQISGSSLRSSFAALRLCERSSFVPKITDFGLAKDPATSARLTQSGIAVGTPSYMAPEQAQNKGTVGPATDIYALGAILYEMLTGRPPFDADTPAETIAQLLQEEPLSPARLRPRLPRDLVTICLKCLEKSPRRRYATAWDLAEDLRHFQAGEPIRARPVSIVERAYRWARRRPLVAALLALCASLTVAFLITVLVYDALLREALRQTAALAEEERRQIVQLDDDSGVLALEEEDTFTAAFYFTEALRLDKGSPDRNHRTRIATTLRQTPELLSPPTLETPILPEPLAGAALSPDGRFLAVIGNSGTMRVADLRTKAIRALAVEGGEAVRRLTFHAEGRLLLAQQANGVIRSWDLSQQDPATPQGFAACEAGVSAVSENGRWLFTLDATRRGEVRDVATGKSTAPPLQRGQDVKRCAVSSDGRRLALVGPDNVLTVWDVAAGRALGNAIPLPHHANEIVFSPDAEHVLTTGVGPNAQVWQVPTGELQAAWSRLDSAVAHARFSPDGRLVLLGNGAGKVQVWDAFTAQAVTPPLRNAGPLVLAAFHDEGKQVVTVGASGVVRWWQLPRVSEVSDAPALGGGPAPAGEAGLPLERRSIRLESGVTVAMKPTTAGALRPPVAEKLVEYAAFSPDGGRVVVCDDDSTVRVWDAATGTPRTPLLRHRGTVLFGAFSSDGTRLITASNDRIARVWDAVTGEVLAPPLHHNHAITAVYFQAGSDRACVMQEGGIVTTWDLTPDERSINDLLALVRAQAARNR